MDVLSYLSELVQTRKAVGISGLGTVFKKKLPGRFDAATHSFVPPSYTLDFTTEVREETILPDYIAKKRNISVETASYFINEFSSETLMELDTYKIANLGSLGKLVKKDEQLHFEPAATVNFGFDFYGLPAVKEEQEAAAEDINEIESVDEVEEITAEPTPEVTASVEPASAKTKEAEQRVAVEAEALPVIQEQTPVEPIISETRAVEPKTEESISADLSSDEAVAEEVKTPAAKEELQPDEPIQADEPIQVEEPAQIEEPTVESVIADNLSQEENPGDEGASDPVEAFTHQDTVTEPAEPAESVTEEKTEEASSLSKDEKQLREEIEALNFYRSKSPYLKSTGPEDEDVILKLKHPTINDSFADKAVNDAYPVYPAQPEEPKAMPAYLKVLLGLMILAAILVAAYFSKPEWFSAITGDPAPTVQNSTAPQVKPAPVPAVADSSITSDSLQKADTVPFSKDSILTSLPVKPADTATVYEIIGASMHDQKEADKFIELMKRSGVQAKVVTNMSGKRLKMSIATLKDEKSAKLELERLSKKLKIPGIYIYRNKQN